MIMVPMNPKKVKKLRTIMMENIQKMMDTEIGVSIFIDPNPGDLTMTRMKLR